MNNFCYKNNWFIEFATNNIVIQNGDEKVERKFLGWIKEYNGNKFEYLRPKFEVFDRDIVVYADNGDIFIHDNEK